MPTVSGTVAASLHRGWMTMGSSILHDPKRIIAACETGEHAAYDSYEAASNKEFLHSQTRTLIQRQFQAVKRSCEWLAQVYRELASGVQLVP
jgi:uncharacterized protein (TIGR02284 family)